MTKPAKRKNVYMNEETSRALKRLGGGNVSKGIREAVRLAEAVKPDVPSQCASEGETPASDQPKPLTREQLHYQRWAD